MFNKLRTLNNEDTNDKNVYIIFILKGKRQRIKMTSREVKYSIGKKVSNIVVYMGSGGLLEIWGEHFVKYMTV